jgi:hypothetical protein
MGHTVRLLVVIVALLGPTVVLAHDGEVAQIHVPADHVMPGEPFLLVAADFDPGSSVEISVLDGDHVERLATVIAEDDGHFEVDLQLPADNPHGYFQLVGFSEFGVRAETWVLVGPRAEGPPPADPAGGQVGLPFDPSVILLGVLIGGAGVALLYLVLKPGSRRGRSRRGR